jgi:hypothetical protein
MPKSFKKFREEWDDEWGNDNDFRRKDEKLRERRDQKRKKTHEKFSKFDNQDEE